MVSLDPEVPCRDTDPCADDTKVVIMIYNIKAIIVVIIIVIKICYIISSQNSFDFTHLAISKLDISRP